LNNKLLKKSYVGGVSNRKRCGQGTFIGKDKLVEYKGEWKLDEYHGLGTLFNPEPSDARG
jgi:hypothetical protein